MLYLISDRQALRRKPEETEAEIRLHQLAVLRQALEAGCRLIQIREKDLDDPDLRNLTQEVLRLARPLKAQILVNDRLEVALATGAAGVHLRASSMPVPQARAIAAGRGVNELLIGVSTHSLAEARTAEAGGADFIVCGPVYPTPSKMSYGPPLGIQAFAEICRSVTIPVLALGGLNLANFRETLRHGAAGIAGIGLFTDPQQLQQNIETIMSAKI